MKYVSSAEAKARLAALVAEVAGGSDYVVIKRRGRPVAAIVRAEEAALLEGTRATSDRPIGALALVGGWRDVPDEQMDEWIARIYLDRGSDTGRLVRLEP